MTARLNVNIDHVATVRQARRAPEPSVGMTVPAAIARVTVNASRVFPVFGNRGTLKVNAPADVAILDLRQGQFDFLDNFNGTTTAGQRLFPNQTVLAGRRIQRT